MFDYTEVNQFEQFSFIRISRALIAEGYSDSLSLQAEVFYGILLDRMSKSSQNHWLDEEGKAYTIYPVNEIQEDLNLSRRKIMGNLSELEKVSLVERKKQGNGKPNCIHVKNFIVEPRQQECRFCTSESERKGAINEWMIKSGSVILPGENQKCSLSIGCRSS